MSKKRGIETTRFYIFSNLVIFFIHFFFLSKINIFFAYYLDIEILLSNSNPTDYQFTRTHILLIF